MKNTPISFLYVAILMFTLTVSNSFPRDSDGRFYTNPYLLNGKAFNFEQLSSLHTGKLSIVQTHQETATKTKMPFYAYIRRNGKIIDADSYSHNHAVTVVEISEILKSARPGDELVIDPAIKNKGIQQRSVILQSSSLKPPFQWFFLDNKSKNNC